MCGENRRSHVGLSVEGFENLGDDLRRRGQRDGDCGCHAACEALERLRRPASVQGGIRAFQSEKY